MDFDELYEKFKNYVVLVSGDENEIEESEVFGEFFMKNRSIIKTWLDVVLSRKETKCNVKSEKFRQEGNVLFGKKDYENCMIKYTSSQCFAKADTNPYVFSYTNKSVLLLEIGDYKNCLSCIKYCLKLNCPEHTKAKLYLRKAKCHYHLKELEQMEETINEGHDFINISSIDLKEKVRILKEFGKLIKTCDNNKKKGIQHSEVPLPELTEGSNELFLFASSSLKLRKTNHKGRHVITEKKLNVGDVLFIEKAYCTVPILPDGKEVKTKLNKCFYCLSDVLVGLPCTTCTMAIYCNETCRRQSWEEHHKWECVGMQSKFWQEIGIGFPAFRTFLKGIPSKFQSLPSDYDVTTSPFGDIKDNYRFFNILVTNLSKMKNVIKLILNSSIIVLYLENYTDFFNDYPETFGLDKISFMNLTGGLICRHIAQLISNSSAIHHPYVELGNVEEIPRKQTTVASGIFPSISMTNHSCRPNISIYYVKDIAIVKACENIQVGSEILNCYGLDYRLHNKDERQEVCQEIYFFSCDCVICRNPLLELEYFDSFSCEDCEGPLVNTQILNDFICLNCAKINEPLIETEEVNAKINVLLKDDVFEESILSCLEQLKEILYYKHSCFPQLYAKLADVYSERGDLKNLVKYSNLIVQCEKRRTGKYSKVVGIKLYLLANCILNILKKKNVFELDTYREELNDLSKMVVDVNKITSLYFHFDKEHFKTLLSAVNTFRTILETSPN